MNIVLEKINSVKYILVLYLFVLGMYGYWIFLNNAPLSWDQSGYMTVTAQLGWAIKKLDFRQVICIFLHHDAWGNRPALFMLVGGFIFNIAGSSVKLIVFLSNTFWLGILTYSTFKLSMLFSRSQKVAFIAVFIVLTSPGISILSRDYTVDLPLTAALTLFYYRLFVTDYFNKKIISLVFSLIFLALIKESFALYVVPLFFMIFVYLIFGEVVNRQRRIINYIISSIVSILVLLIFYYPIFELAYANIVANVGESLGQYYSRGIEKTNINFYLYYIWVLLSDVGLSFLYFVILTYLIIISKKRLNGYEQLFICSSLLFSIIGLTFVTDVNFRFLVPLIPLVVVCFVSFISEVKHLALIITVVVFMGLFQFYSYLYGLNLLSNYSIGYIKIWSNQEINTSGQRDGLYNKTFYNVVPIIIDNINNKYNISDISLLIGSNSTFFNPNIFQSYMNLNLNKLPKLYNGDIKLTLDEIEGYDVVIIKSKNSASGCPMCIESEYMAFNNKVSELQKQNIFKILNTYNLSDGSQALVYVKNNNVEKHDVNR